MSRTMYDSTVTTDIPTDAELVAYYPNAFPGPVNQFKNARIVTIDNKGDDHTLGVLDVETGAASVADAPSWLDEKIASGGGVGSLYCNKSTLPALVKSIGSRKAYLWIADPTGAAHEASLDLPDNVKLVATQYAWPAIGSPGHYDMSLVSDDDWYKATDPAPAPVATTKGVVITSALDVHDVESSDGKTWTTVAS
jgi:hypothetical protein